MPGPGVDHVATGRYRAPVQLHRIADRDGWSCWLCGGEIDPGAPVTSPARGTVDHLVPRSRGGSSELANLRLAHRRCNHRRGSLLPEMHWPDEWPMLMTVHVWTALARLAPRPGAAEVVAVAPLREVADDAASWLVERAEAFVPGGWESWCVEESSGPVAVWLRRPADAAPGTAGRPKHPDA